MPALTLDGITVPVAAARWLTDDTVGADGRSMMGAAQPGVRSRKRVLQVVTAPVSQADAEALRALGATATVVAVGGDLPGDLDEAFVDVDRGGILKGDVGDGYAENLERLTITVREA